MSDPYYAAMRQRNAALSLALNQRKSRGRWHSLNEFGLTPHFNQLGEFHMASTSFLLELRVNFNDEDKVSKETHLQTLTAQFANVLLANAMLLQDRTEPYISLVKQNLEDGTQRVDIKNYPVQGECPTCGHELDKPQDEEE